MLEFRQVHKAYATPQGPLQVLAGVDLTLAPGESLALMGESGSGKSTLLHLAAGLDLPDAGEVRLGGRAISTLTEPERARLRRESLGLVFQQFHLVPSLTVLDNLRLQARLAGREDSAWSAELIARLGLAGLEGRYPSSSAWPSAVPWRRVRRCCWPTNPPATWTRPPPARYWNCCCRWSTRPAVRC